MREQWRKIPPLPALVAAFLKYEAEADSESRVLTEAEKAKFYEQMNASSSLRGLPEHLRSIT